jgi:hypothetical protein
MNFLSPFSQGRRGTAIKHRLPDKVPEGGRSRKNPTQAMPIAEKALPDTLV